MRFPRYALTAFAVLTAIVGRVAAYDGVWISQVSAAFASSGSREFEGLVAAGCTFRPSVKQSNLQTLMTPGPSLDRRIVQSGEGNWIVGVLTASTGSVWVEQSGFGNGVGVQQDDSAYHLSAIQWNHGNDMLFMADRRCAPSKRDAIWSAERVIIAAKRV